MRFPFAASCQGLIRPGAAFATPSPGLGRALRDMALVWMPLAFLNAVWTASLAIGAYAALWSGTISPGIQAWFGVNPLDLRELLSALPAAPAFGRVWPWLLLAVPLGVLGTWLHHAVWDHLGLWLLGGLKQNRGFRTTLIAEAEALRIAAVGTLLGLLGFVPVLGTVMALPLLLLDAYLWLFRGFALAARHGCEPWRGIGATLVHVVLLGGFALGLFSLMLVLLRMAA
jgi:hypothetical protein